MYHLWDDVSYRRFSTFCIAEMLGNINTVQITYQAIIFHHFLNAGTSMWTTFSDKSMFLLQIANNCLPDKVNWKWSTNVAALPEKPARSLAQVDLASVGFLLGGADTKQGSQLYNSSAAVAFSIAKIQLPLVDSGILSGSLLAQYHLILRIFDFADHCDSNWTYYEAVLGLPILTSGYSQLSWQFGNPT